MYAGSPSLNQQFFEQRPREMPEDRPERMAYPFPLPSDFLDEDPDGNDTESASPFAIMNSLLRHAKWVVGLPLLALVLTTAYLSTREHLWVADSRFLPAKADFGAGANAGGVMTQLNRLVGGPSGGSDGVFYSFLAQSTAFLREGARAEYEFTRATDTGEEETVSGSLAEIYGLQPADETADVRASLGILKSLVSSRVEPGTGFVVISVRAPWPDLAVVVNERLLELVNEFNVEQRQSQAAAEREFVESRMAEARAELQQAEAALVQFLEQNQRHEQAPRLRYEAMRLESDVELKRSIYSGLAQSFEQARINEVRNTPVVTVVESPAETVYRPNSGNAPLRYGMMAFLIVALLTIGAVGARAYFARQREKHPDDFAEFRRLAWRSVPLPRRLRSRLAERSDRGNGREPATAGVAGSGDSPDSW